MQTRIIPTRPTRSAAERAHLTFWTLGATDRSEALRGEQVAEIDPVPTPVVERIRRLPEALLLTTGYYAGKAPIVADLLRRTHC